MNATHIAIAEVPIQIETPASAIDLGLQHRYGPFLTAPREGGGVVKVRWCEGDVGEVPPGRMIYDPGSIWRMYIGPTGQEFFASLDYSDSQREVGGRALLKANPGWDDLVVRERPDGPAWQSLLNVGLGELILRTRIIFEHGVVFHAAGLDDRGRGLLFVGHSEAGKSTQAAIWNGFPGVLAMNDDRVAARLTAGGAAIYGTPWGGERSIARNHKAPLAAVIVLEQASGDEILELSGRRCLPMLAARAFIPYWDPKLVARALDILERLVEAVPVYLLRCRPEPSVVPLVRSVL